MSLKGTSEYISVVMPVGTATSLASGFSSFMLHTVPAMQWLSLLVSILAGAVTIVYYLRHISDKK